MPSRDPRDAGGPVGVDGLEAAAAALVEDADEVDDGVRPGDRGIEDFVRCRDVDMHRHDLADIAGRLQEGRGDRVAAGHADDPALGGQPSHDIASDEAGAAENRDAPTVR